MKKLHPDFIGSMEEMLQEIESNIDEACAFGREIAKAEESYDENNDAKMVDGIIELNIAMTRLGFETIKRWDAIRWYFDESIQIQTDKLVDALSTDDETEEKE